MYANILYIHMYVRIYDIQLYNKYIALIVVLIAGCSRNRGWKEWFYMKQ